MIRSAMDRQRESEEGMTRKEIDAMIDTVTKAAQGELSGRVAEVLRDQLGAICEAEKITCETALRLLKGPWLLNALARSHHYSTPREALQGFYNWLRNEENEAILLQYRLYKY